MRPPTLWWLSDSDFVGFRVVRPVVERGQLVGVRPLVTKDSP